MSDREKTPATDTAQIDPAEMRRVMGHFATGVTVVTGVDDDEPVGFACQSFASVSLEPPMILFCADHRGKAWPRIQNSGKFCVNILAEDQEDVCARFGSWRGEKFDGLAWELSEHGAPALPDTLARVHCEVAGVHVEGDHDVVIGRVLGLETGTQTRPMVFYRGKFGIERHEQPTLADLKWGWGDHWG